MREELLRLLATFPASSPGERAALEMTRNFVRTHACCLHRANLQGHLTASAFLVDPARRRFVLVRHRKLDRWLQPGGHADGDPDLLAVARREAEEETGLRRLRAVTPQVFDLDIHPIPASAGVPAHLHYDVRFLLEAEPGERLRLNEAECTAVAWHRELSPELDESVVRMARKVLRRRKGWI